MEVSNVLNGLVFAQLGGGALAGLAVGYALKRTTKIALFIVGLSILFLYGMMKAGYISVNWEAVTQGLEHGTRSLASVLAGVVKDLSASLVGFAGGFFLGLKLR